MYIALLYFIDLEKAFDIVHWTLLMNCSVWMICIKLTATWLWNINHEWTRKKKLEVIEVWTWRRLLKVSKKEIKSKVNVSN